MSSELLQAIRLQPAEPDEVLIASQKDSEHCEQLCKQLSAAFAGLFGSHAEHTWKHELKAFSSLLYLGLTAGIGRQTPGEEYSDLTLVRVRDGLAASIPRRWVGLALQLVIPYFLQKLCTHLVAWARNGDECESWLLRTLVQRLQEPLEAFERISRAFFILFGGSLLWSHRLVGLRHVRHSAFPPRRSTLASIGMVMLIQNGLDVVSHALRVCHATSRPQNSFISSTPVSEEARTCSLCLAQRRHPSITPCGHVFCWLCIHEWLADKQECPLCRKEITPQSVWSLHHYH